MNSRAVFPHATCRGLPAAGCQGPLALLLPCPVCAGLAMHLATTGESHGGMAFSLCLRLSELPTNSLPEF